MRNILALLAMLSFGNASLAAELFATVESLSGSASLSDPAGQRSDIAVGQRIYEKQTISTARDGEVHLATVDGGIVALRQNTVFRVDEYKADGSAGDRVFMSLTRGAIRSITGWIGKYNAPGYRITTPTATIGIRGTDHETTVIEGADSDEPGTYEMVNEGITLLKTQYGESEVTPEKFAFAPRYRAVAPLLLAQKPGFLAKRRLKTEERIEQRKESLHDRIEQIREERIEHLEKIRGAGQAGEKTEPRRETPRKEAKPGQGEKPEGPRAHREKPRKTTPGGPPEKAERRPARKSKD
jgi:hypothetical protein